MKPISLDELKRLLETDRLPGSPRQLRKLRIRVTELLQLNGEVWVRANRTKLLDQWRTIVDKGLIS